MQELADREECRVFDDLKDEKALAEAVKSGAHCLSCWSFILYDLLAAIDAPCQFYDGNFGTE